MVKINKLLLSFLTVFSLAIPASAKDLYDVTWHVPNTFKIYNYNDKFYSNIDENKIIKQSDKDEFLNSNNSYYQVSVSPDSISYPVNRTLFKVSDTINFNYSLPAINSGYNNSIYGFDFYYWNEYTKLKFNTKYQILYRFNKSSSLEYTTLSNDDIEVSLDLMDLDSYEITTVTNSTTDLETSNKASVLNASFTPQLSNTDSSKYSNFAYLLITFQFDDGSLNLENFALDSVSLKTNPLTTKTFIKNQSDKVGKLNVSYFALMENSSIYIPRLYGSSGGIHGDGGGRHDNLERLNEDDLIKFNELENCEKGDIICHVRNIVTTIKNLFTRIGSGFANLMDFLYDFFVPSDSYFVDYLGNFSNLFINKLGFVVYPFELMGNLLNRYLNLSTNPVINIPDVKEPFSGHTLISARTYNIQEIFNTGSIKTLYDIYMSFVSVILIFGFGNFCIKKYNEFVKNKGGITE